MKKLKNELFIYFTLPSILGLILLYISIIVIFNYKYRTVVINRLQDRISLIKEQIFENYKTMQSRHKMHMRHHRNTRMPARMPFMRERFPYMAFIIHDTGGEIVFSNPPSFKEENYIKINKGKVFNENKNQYVDIFIKKNRLYSRREKGFFRILFIYSFILLIILIGIFFYISHTFSEKILKFFKKMKLKFTSIAKGNYDIKINNEYKEFEPFKKGVENMANLLDKEEERRKEFITNISHDIKTPISIIRANLEGILDGVLKESNDNLKLILGEVDNLEELIERIKYFDKNDKKSIKCLNFNKKLKNYQNKYRNMIDIKLDIPKNLNVKFNETDFDTIFDNLITNSYKYNDKEKKKCLIKIKKKKNNLIVKIADNGEGIKEKDRKLIFEKFYKEEKARTDRKSMGLGLSIVKKIVNNYEGYVDVISKRGFYTVIKIILRNLDYK